MFLISFLFSSSPRIDFTFSSVRGLSPSSSIKRSLYVETANMVPPTDDIAPLTACTPPLIKDPIGPPGDPIAAPIPKPTAAPVTTASAPSSLPNPAPAIPPTIVDAISGIALGFKAKPFIQEKKVLSPFAWLSWRVFINPDIYSLGGFDSASCNSLVTSATSESVYSLSVFILGNINSVDLASETADSVAGSIVIFPKSSTAADIIGSTWSPKNVLFFFKSALQSNSTGFVLSVSFCDSEEVVSNFESIGTSWTAGSKSSFFFTWEEYLVSKELKSLVYKPSEEASSYTFFL